ncbi:ribonuclease G [Flexibacter flexilis DSM 6793]|uniref:Ribonuclease G n=1 Tax=Flexibacter flexilis DSM 6793 TaxID=927664 RepID=A0A1I1MUI2_9BACT|nr:Rne/Rng family ribonuclease [Flexibacter flexilis]SFC89074.1 ribonuclease G [Flexibacter flexilis DSM 6793]
MSNELLISSTQKGDRIALLQNKQLIEYHVEENGNTFTVGDIYLGVVRKVSKGLNAAFVDIGHEKDAFLHYQDLGPNIRSLNKFLKNSQSNKAATHKLNGFKYEPEIEKLGNMTQVLSKGQQVLVQVIKEPISTKGPRLSCELSLAGRYIVLVPFSDAISISKKITSKEERQRLSRLMQSIKPDNFGVIIRTVAEGKDVAELDKDLSNLVQKWEEGFGLLRTARPRDKVIGEMNRVSSMLRDLLNESFDGVSVDSKEIYDEVKNYIRNFAPDKEKIVRLHTGKAKLFEAAGIEKQLKTLFGKSVSLPSGGYLIIEHTEALHVIDVNSGSSANKAEAEDQETTAFNANKEAAREIARQLRLRDMGGIIVIDFIDMKKAENKRLIYEQMKTEMQGERSKFTVLPLSKFGLMQITRQRVRPEMNVITLETCPTCNGTGKISASILVADLIEQNIEFIVGKQNEKGLTVRMHPFLYSYYTKGFFSRQVQWLFRYHTWIKVVEDTSLGVTDFKFINKQGEQIEIS